MFRVNGLYGHIQRNNLKTAVLIAGFLALAVSTSVGVMQLKQHIVQLPAGVGGESLLRQSLDPNAPTFQYSNSQFTTPRPQGAPKATDNSVAPFDLSAMRYFRRPEMFLLFASPLEQAKWALLLALVYLACATWWNSQYIRYALRAKPLKRSANPDLYNIVENLAMSAGIPCPAIEVIASPQLNAYASGLTPASARVGLTTGLIERLSPREIEAVVAHELTHILYRDSRLMAVTKSCFDLNVLGPLRYVQRIRQRPLTLLPLGALLFMGSVQPIVFVALLGLLGGTVLLAFLAKALVMQSREFVADAGAVELTKSPEALISALYRISGDQYVPEGQLFAQAMMISGSWRGWFSTHPSIEARVAALRMIGGVTAEIETAFAPFASAPAEGPRVRRVPGLAGFDASRLPVSESAPAPRFGRRNAEPSASFAFRDAAPRGSFGARAAPGLPQDAKARAVAPQDISWAAVSDEENGELGDSWFERWVMSGRINRIAASVQSTRKQGARGVAIIYGGIMLFGFVVTALTRM
jgi:heat shock protein HtpX